MQITLWYSMSYVFLKQQAQFRCTKMFLGCVNNDRINSHQCNSTISIGCHAIYERHMFMVSLHGLAHNHPEFFSKIIWEISVIFQITPAYLGLIKWGLLNWEDRINLQNYNIFGEGITRWARKVLDSTDKKTRNMTRKKHYNSCLLVPAGKESNA